MLLGVLWAAPPPDCLCPDTARPLTLHQTTQPTNISIPNTYTLRAVRAQGEDDWMTKYFFSGGTMPSMDLLLHFQASAAHFRAAVQQ